MDQHEAVTTYRETECKPTGFVLGVDLGQSHDYTAAVVNERCEGRVLTLKKKRWQVEPEQTGSRVLVRHRIKFIHRYVLGTPYPQIASSIKSLLAQLPEMRDQPELFVDGTGVGVGVVDIFREAGLSPISVAITAGTTVNRISSHEVRVPKRELASLTQAVLQSGRIEIARDLSFSRLLEDELANFRVKISQGGDTTYEGRSNVHGDLVLALAIALWGAEKKHDGPGAAIYEVMRREMEAYHKANGGKPEPIRPSWQPGSVEYAAEQARIAAEKSEKGS
jgi:hypothetical protein